MNNQETTGDLPGNFGIPDVGYTLDLGLILSSKEVPSYCSEVAQYLQLNPYSTLGEILSLLKIDQIEYLLVLVEELRELIVKDPLNSKVKTFSWFTGLCLQAEGFTLDDQLIRDNIPVVAMSIVLESLSRKSLVEIDYKKFSLSNNSEEFVKVRGSATE